MNRLGLEVLSLGNADLYGEGQWTGTPETADGSAAPIGAYPKPEDLPQLSNEPRAFLIGLGLGALCMAVAVFL